MIKLFKITFLSFILLFSTLGLKAQADTIIGWPIISNYTTFNYHTDTVEFVSYLKGSGITESAPSGVDGQWFNFPSGYIETNDYFQISFSPADNSLAKQIDLTKITFQAKKTNSSATSPKYFLVSYSKSSDFESDSTLVIDYPDGLLPTAFQTFNFDFDVPIQLDSTDTLRIRIYAYDSSTGSRRLHLKANSFFILGNVYDASPAPSVSGLSFERTCVSEGRLSWNLPSGFDSNQDTIVVFAKKFSTVNQMNPIYDVNIDYGVPETDLAYLDGVVPGTIQYEHDASAMLVYRGVGTSVDMTNFEDGSTYYFLVYNVKGGGVYVYSNGKIKSGASPAVLANVSGANYQVSPNEVDLSWTNPFCFDSIMVVVKESDDIISGNPSGSVTDYASGVSNVYTVSTSYFNGVDDSDGKVLYVGTAGAVNITGLTNDTRYQVTIWVEDNSVWSTGVYFSVYPNEYEGIITQTRSEGTDFTEFITLKEIDFSSADIRLSNYPTCETGRMYFGGGNATGSIFSTLGVVPAGTFIRVYSQSGANETNFSDGIVSFSTTLFALKSFGGDQVMIYKGAGLGDSFDPYCGIPASVNQFVAGFNYGNAGWLTPGSNLPVDANTSYAPPSVSNLLMPSTSTPNFSLKDLNAISGSLDAIHDGISNVATNWSTGSGSSPLVRLKNIKFDQSDYFSGSIALTLLTDSVLVDFSALTFTNDVDIRYMIVANEGSVGDAPVDRYTCYTANKNYSLAPSVVSSVANQVSLQNPCGVPTTGEGKVVYFGNSMANVKITNLPCGSEVFFSVYAVRGNGYTSNMGLPTSSSIVTPDAPVTYYSAGTGNIGDAVWATTPAGVGGIISFGNCVSLVIENGDVITFDEQVKIGDLRIATGGQAVMVDDIDLYIAKTLQAEANFVVSTDTKIIFDGVNQADSITGAGLIEFDVIEVRNVAVGADKLVINTNVRVIQGIEVTSGDIDVISGSTVTLVSALANRAAYLGELPTGSVVTGEFIVERYLQATSSVAPGNNAAGVGWRYTTSTVQGSTYEDYMDDQVCTGFTGSHYPNFATGAGYYFPNLQKYTENVAGTQNNGFDGDAAGAAPTIFNRRDKTEPIAAGEGIFSYMGGTPLIFDFQGVPNQGDITVNFTYTDNGLPGDDGWNLLANPYQCPIDLRLVTKSSNVDGTVYIYNTTNGNYQLRHFSNGNPQLLAAGQGFWIKANAVGSPQVIFTEAAKVESYSTTYYKEDDSYNEGLSIEMYMQSDTNYYDITTIWVNDEATSDFDNEYDAYKKYGLVADLSNLATRIENFDYDITVNAIPPLSNGIDVPVKVYIKQAGNYIFDFKYLGSAFIGSCITFTDLVADTSFIIDQTSEYTFYSALNNVNAAPRFNLHISVPIELEYTDAVCFEGTDATAIAEGVGAGPFTYNWSNANSEIIFTETVSGASTLENIGYGFYSVSIEGNATECGTSALEFMVMQPAEYENTLSRVNPTCNLNDGYINVELDSLATWNVAWTNTSTGQTGQASGLSDFYAILGLGHGEWEVTTTSECGAQSYIVVLEDLNDVIADFEVPSTAVYIQDGEVFVEFPNTSENASEFSWFYADDQEAEDHSVNGSYTFTEAGVYGISLVSMNANGCYDVITYELVVLDATGVTELPGGVIRSYIAYGNGNPQYVIELDQDKQVHVQMVNSMGQVISTQLVNVSGKTMVDLPTYDLSSGIYLIITLDDGTRIDTKKLFVR